jgi:hypothetical protein
MNFEEHIPGIVANLVAARALKLQGVEGKENEVKGNKRIVIGRKPNSSPVLYFMNHPDFDDTHWNNPSSLMSGRGWSHFFSVRAFDSEQPGTAKFEVYETFGPHRMFINQVGAETNENKEMFSQSNSRGKTKWTKYMEFWAYAQPPPDEQNLVQVFYGQAFNQCSTISLNLDDIPDDQTINSFYAFE